MSVRARARVRARAIWSERGVCDCAQGPESVSKKDTYIHIYIYTYIHHDTYT